MKSLRIRAVWLVLCSALMFTQPAAAHVGSKDVFEQVSAGPYRLFVTVRMPSVIPGVAIVEVRATGAPIQQIRITPLPITGEAALHPPTPDVMVRSKEDAEFFTGQLWMMTPGSWQVRFGVTGSGGEATASVPVPAVATQVLTMTRGLGIPLACLALFLMISMAGIVAAVVREGDLQPGIQPERSRARRGWIAAGWSFALLCLILYGGIKWWHVEAAAYAGDIYRPLAVQPVLVGNVLDLRVSSFTPRNKLRMRANNDFLPDHGHLMHLYAIRWPAMDAVYHLHPSLVAPGDFRLILPQMPAGPYHLYGDIVHANGFPETLVTTLNVPENMQGGTPGPDDATALIPALSSGALGDAYKLPDGYTMVWEKPQTLEANRAYIFHFALMDAQGRPAADTVTYMGMAGHAAFVKTDGTVFAHTHPEGSAAMASLMLANANTDYSMGGMASDASMMSMAMPDTAVPPAVEFPYGFPSAGTYRIFVQMKHGGAIETGAFDAVVR